MAFRSQTYRVMIASPSDLIEERVAATEAVNEWNSQHAAAESIVLLPVKWETHATPRAGVRPQEAINEQLVRTSDIMIGIFWTKIGTSTGVAESGTVEEIDQFAAAGKPTMLYFSSRPIDPNKIDVKQHQKLKKFKANTYKKAIVGGFNDVDRFRQTLLRDLTNEVRRIRPRKSTSVKLDQAEKITELIRIHKRSRITPEMFQAYRDEFLGPRSRPKSLTTDPVPEGEVGPNGHRVGYTEEGDKVEWIPDDENPGEEWPMILRRNDEAILAQYNEYWDKVWYNRHMVSMHHIESGQEKPSKGSLPFIEKGKKAARQIEKKYGKKNLIVSDFDYGVMYGRMTAFAWVTGADWEVAGDT